MGRLIISKTRDYLYIASGTGLSPNINGLRFYDSGLIYNGKKSFYSENGQYAIWYNTIGVEAWYIGPIANIGTFTTNSWTKIGATDITIGSYPATLVSTTGTVTISEYKNKISIKKQSLSTLIPFQIGIDVYSNNRYIFKSATTNLLGTVFNPSLFNAPYQDILNIYTPNGEQLTFYFDGSEWIYSDFSPNANNYVIPNNSIIEITTDNITSVPVGGGAIIQKYNSGKINLFKSSIAPSLVATPLGIGFNVYSGNSTSPGMPQTISYFGNPLDRIGYISNFLTNTNHYWTFTIANGYKIYFALDSDGYSPSNIDSSIAIRSGNTWVESNILSQQNFGQNQQGQYILSSAHPYAAGTYTLKITNSTATSVTYTIRFIITAA